MLDNVFVNLRFSFSYEGNSPVEHRKGLLRHEAVLALDSVPHFCELFFDWLTSALLVEVVFFLYLVYVDVNASDKLFSQRSVVR
jgi:hypothetical protein